MDKHQIVQYIRSNPDFTYEQLKVKIIEAKIPLEVYDQAWAEVNPKTTTIDVKGDSKKKNIVIAYCSLVLVASIFFAYKLLSSEEVEEEVVVENNQILEAIEITMESEEGDDSKSELESEIEELAKSEHIIEVEVHENNENEAPKEKEVLVNFRILESVPHILSESSLNQEPKMSLYMDTVAEYSCLLPINASLEVNDKLISLNIHGTTSGIDTNIPLGNVCASALGPASFSEYLYLDVGVYMFEINLEPETDKYLVTVTEEIIKITEIEAVFSNLEEAVVNRINTDVISATCDRYEYACEEGDQINELCPIFFEEIEKIAERIMDEETNLQYCGEDNGFAECRVYLYTSDYSLLEEIYKGADNYDLEYGHQPECRDADLYWKEIVTPGGKINYFKYL